ncbi:MAG: DUF3352 domain-containing protein [Planctomycetes bacterium]|nr:DUF3352 domain-containing protein [Planctomycetota bacterium]
MRNRPRFSLVHLAAAAALLAAFRPALAADKVPAEELLPQNVYAYLSVPDVTEFKTRFDKTLLGQLRNEESLQDFWKDIQSQIDQFSEEFERQAGIEIEKLLSIPTGKFTLAFVQPTGENPAAVGLLDFGDSEETVDKLLEKAEETLLSERVGARRKVEDADGTRIVVYAFGPEQPEDDTGANNRRRGRPFQNLAYFVRDQHLVVSSEVSSLKEILARWNGEHEQTFASHPSWQVVRDRTRVEGQTPVLEWYLNPLDMVRGAAAAAGQGAQVGFFMGIIPGLTKFKAVGGSSDMAVGEYDTISRTLIHLDLPATGVLNLFQFPAADLAPPKWVGERTSSYAAINWDLETAYLAVAALYDTFTFQAGAFDQMIDEAADDEDGPGIHAKKDVIDLLTGRMYVVGSTQDAGDDNEVRTEAMLVAVGVKDNDKARALLKKVAQNPAFPGEERQFQEHTIYDFPIGGGAFGTAATTGGVSVGNGYLLATSDVRMLEKVLRGEDDRTPLSETAAYKRIAAEFPDKASMIGFQRSDMQVEALYELARSPDFAAMFPQVDFTKLPPFDNIRKYLAPSGSYAVPDKDGALMVNFSLKSAE